MIVCYAAGGGLGHLTRIRAFLHMMRPGRDAVILTSSKHASDPRVVGPYRTLGPPPGADPAAWYVAALREWAPEELIVDAFPGGLHGELTPATVPATVRTRTHLARLMQWTRYRGTLTRPLPRYDQTWYVETLTDDHHADLAAVSGTLGPLEIVDPPAPDLTVLGAALDPVYTDDAWLVVHSGPAAEVAELIGYAEETAAREGVLPRLVLVAPAEVAPEGVYRVDVYPAWPLFPRASRIISAAGWNIVRQAAPWRDRHRMLPFPRLFDDQFTRAARARSGPAGDRRT